MLAVHLVCPIGGDDQHVCGAQTPGRVIEQLARRGVRPLEVFEDQQKRTLGGCVAEQHQDGFEEAHLGLSRFSRARRRPAQLGKQLRELVRRGAQPSRELGGVRFGKVVSDCLQERQVWE